MSTWNARLARLFLEQKKALEAFVARRIGNRQVAANLTQEAFLRLARLSAGEGIDNLPAFLFTVAGNLLLDHPRQAARRGLVEGEMPQDEPPCQAPGLVERLAGEQEERLLRDAIEALPQPWQRIFRRYSTLPA